ncbi:exocyst complex component EXO70A1 [Cajanus cajan]|uniref:exocyst complex component EXO70A1 n=1 Tax=Cajanus cajan TaxID=3821 RepID=UPI00098D88CC|nr:exocyst complex component EXO70A1 [Cajanus cajan]XP_020203048.1 exocyst complex component EXO70A1 [Cajanus cajan]XP_020203049.1 exocyst complex component EXO70A1 [Cajanus cajan]XP_020203050.1 exocyst complex component EXO70A1 [Cajanus cajan]XP_020203051.1 exocyst complex component EXO70A1 [Cajanus cajan]
MMIEDTNPLYANFNGHVSVVFQVLGLGAAGLGWCVILHLDKRCNKPKIFLSCRRDARGRSSGIARRHRTRLPKIETLLKGKACSGIKETATSLTKHLAQRAQETFEEFEVEIEKDAIKTAVTDGTVHPLTRSVINYVRIFIVDLIFTYLTWSKFFKLCSYQSTLMQLFLEFESGDDFSQLAYVTV